MTRPIPGPTYQTSGALSWHHKLNFNLTIYYHVTTNFEFVTYPIRASRGNPDFSGEELVTNWSQKNGINF